MAAALSDGGATEGLRQQWQWTFMKERATTCDDGDGGSLTESGKENKVWVGSSLERKIERMNTE